MRILHYSGMVDIEKIPNQLNKNFTEDYHSLYLYQYNHSVKIFSPDLTPAFFVHSRHVEDIFHVFYFVKY